MSGPFLQDDFSLATASGIGIAIRELDDERVIASFVLEGSEAEEAGIAPGTEILAFNDIPIDAVIDEAVAWSAPFSTEHFGRLQKLRYATRFAVGVKSVAVTFLNGEGEEETSELAATGERDSFNFSSFNVGRTGFELPVEYKLLEESDYGYVKINSFADNDLLSIQLWERLLRTLNENGVEGLIIDMRQNQGGTGFLADQMAAYFFDEPHILGRSGSYDKSRDEFYFDPRYEDVFYLPADELRYGGEVAVLIGPNCNSACEFFTYDMTIDSRAAIVGQYPTAGLGGSVKQIRLPENEQFQYTGGRAVDAEGEIHIEGKGVPPTVAVPVNEETLLTDDDVILDTAVAWLDEQLAVEIINGGDILVGDEIEGELTPGVRVRYVLTVKEGDVLNITVASDEMNMFAAIYDLADSQLLSNDDLAEGDLNAGWTELEIPADLTLILEVASAGDDETGTYTVTIEDGKK